MEIVKQRISNHPKFGVKREIVVHDAHISTNFNQIVLEASVKYYDENDEEIVGTFVSKLGNWIINNYDFTTVRDQKGNAVPNPEYREAPEEGVDDRAENERNQYLKEPSFDYFMKLIKGGVDLVQLLKLHIAENDKIGFFEELIGER